MARSPKFHPERAALRARELRREHLVARAADFSLVECAVLIREAEVLEWEIREVKAKCKERDIRIAKCALGNPDLSLRDLAERFGLGVQAVAAVLGDAKITKGDLNGSWHKRERI